MAYNLTEDVAKVFSSMLPRHEEARLAKLEVEAVTDEQSSDPIFDTEYFWLELFNNTRASGTTSQIQQAAADKTIQSLFLRTKSLYEQALNFQIIRCERFFTTYVDRVATHRDNTPGLASAPTEQYIRNSINDIKTAKNEIGRINMPANVAESWKPIFQAANDNLKLSKSLIEDMDKFTKIKNDYVLSLKGHRKQRISIGIAVAAVLLTLTVNFNTLKAWANDHLWPGSAPSGITQQIKPEPDKKH